jgi:transcriptional regulator with XRE-family HTH domain
MVQVQAIANAPGMAIDICEQFGANLRRLRRKNGLTQEELAYRVGMDVSYLSELENGRKEPCLRKMKEIAQALGVPLTPLSHFAACLRRKRHSFLQRGGWASGAKGHRKIT